MLATDNALCLSGRVVWTVGHNHSGKLCSLSCAHPDFSTRVQQLRHTVEKRPEVHWYSNIYEMPYSNDTSHVVVFAMNNGSGVPSKFAFTAAVHLPEDFGVWLRGRLRSSYDPYQLHTSSNEPYSWVSMGRRRGPFDSVLIQLDQEQFDGPFSPSLVSPHE